MDLKQTRLLLDLDGTIYIEGKLIGGVREEIEAIHNAGATIHYLTNNTSISSKQYVRKLGRLGLPLDDSCLISPTHVLRRWLLTQNIRQCYIIGTRSFRAEVSDQGKIDTLSNRPQAVIIAFDKELTYAKLKRACLLVKRGVPYYLTHIDHFCPTKTGPIPDCGAIAALIESTTGVCPSGHFGKPGELMANHIRALCKRSDRLLVAGDRVYTDAKLGLELQATTVLVCTGEYSIGDPLPDNRIIVVPRLEDYLRSIRSQTLVKTSSGQDDDLATKRQFAFSKTHKRAQSSAAV